jgi:hypothetical protein
MDEEEPLEKRGIKGGYKNGLCCTKRLMERQAFFLCHGCLSFQVLPNRAGGFQLMSAPNVPCPVAEKRELNHYPESPMSIAY